jgi:alpha-glucosidase
VIQRHNHGVPESTPLPAPTPWWRDAVFYQVYPRSFRDGNGDGGGDLIGLRLGLPYLDELGVDALWLSPFYRSPMADGGYDVSDPCDVDPSFGTLADFDALVESAHAQGLRITIDIVPNHFSDRHPWFQAALAAPPGSPERELFIFRDGQGPDGDGPPNNWPSQFGGSAWQRVADADGTPGQWYLHLFAPEQPDLNWTNPAVPAEFARILRFWLDRGVDGFRVDVAHGMAKPPGLPDMDLIGWSGLPSDSIPGGDLRWDQDGVHEYLRGFRSVIDSYPGDRMAVGEVWVHDDARLALYVRPDELNLTFNFSLLETDWDAAAFAKAIKSSLRAMDGVGAPCTWVLSNHDVVRHVTRYGGGAVGLARARAAALMQLSLPGTVYIYNGDELGLANVDLPDSALQDPIWRRSGGRERGRDGERVPLPWGGTAPPFDFSTTPDTWLPMPPEWSALTIAAQSSEPRSTLRFYRRALAVRRTTSELHEGDFEWLDAPPDCLSYRRGSTFTVLLNGGPTSVPLPPGDVVLASGAVTGRRLPPDSAVWIRSRAARP